jgi:hypothetical protein
LKDKWRDTVGAAGRRAALLAARGAGHALAGRIDEVLGSTHALIIHSLGERCQAGGASVAIKASSAVLTASATVPDAVRGDGEVGLGGAAANAITSRSCKSNATCAVSGR